MIQRIFSKGGTTHIMNESEMNAMFDDIGKAKEDMAKGIIAQQEKEAEEARRHRPFGGGQELYDDSVDLEALERKVDEELRAARMGVPAQKSGLATGTSEETLIECDYVLELQSEKSKEVEPQETMTEAIGITDMNVPVIMAAPAVSLPNSETKKPDSVEETGKNESDTIPESDYVLNLTDRKESPVTDDPAVECSKEEEAEPDIAAQPEVVTHMEKAAPEEPANEICVAEASHEAETKLDTDAKPCAEQVLELTPEIVNEEVNSILQPDITQAKLLVTYAADSGYQYIFSYVTSKGTKSICSETIKAADLDEAIFMTAIEFLKRMEQVEDQTIILKTDEDTASLLRRNAAFGIVDHYSDACASYIEKVRALAAKKSLRVNASNETETDVWQLLEAAL